MLIQHLRKYKYESLAAKKGYIVCATIITFPHSHTYSLITQKKKTQTQQEKFIY